MISKFKCYPKQIGNLKPLPTLITTTAGPLRPSATLGKLIAPLLEILSASFEGGGSCVTAVMYLKYSEFRKQRDNVGTTSKTGK